MSEPTVDSTLRCRYRHSLCLNPRTTKRDGSLHQLCKMHQDRANYNQRIFVARRLQRQRKLSASQYAKRRPVTAASRDRVVEQAFARFSQHEKETRELDELNAAIVDARLYPMEIEDDDLGQLLNLLDVVDLDPFGSS